MTDNSSYNSTDKSSSGNLVELLRQRAFDYPDRIGYTFLPDGENSQINFTYGELDRQSRAIAAQLQLLGATGERALLLYPAGIDYLAAFFGCLYAKVIAVPLYPPNLRHNLSRIEAIALDAQATIALTTAKTQNNLEQIFERSPLLKTLNWIATDASSDRAEDWRIPSVNSDELAYLQYTSGSTSTPKGVKISHANVLYNIEYIDRGFEHTSESVSVTWLPHFHDMGLVDGLLKPLYKRIPCYFMPPTAFIQKPIQWLETISRYKATHSGGPNFAYDLCARKISPQQRQHLDLSSWQVAYNGAEPIHRDTLERFAKAFESCGFSINAFCPAYGMAEATLKISTVRKSDRSLFLDVDAAALEKNKIVEIKEENLDTRTLIGCGSPDFGTKVVIANPDLFSRCGDNEVGEIWVAGTTVAGGYWNRPEETKTTFQAYLVDTGEGPFLRTGDLGFFRKGELFITGRLKDLIIIRGRNLYPQDIERMAESSHPATASGAGAAFSVEVCGEEQLIVVQELGGRKVPNNLDEIMGAIRASIAEECEVQVYAIALIKVGTIPRTTSGKIQRRTAKAEFLSGNLDEVGRSVLELSASEQTEQRLTRQDLMAKSPLEAQPLVEAYLLNLVTRSLKLSPSLVKIEQPIASLGLDSLKVFELKNKIEEDLEVAVSLNDFFEGANVAQWATKILAQVTAKTFIPTESISKVLHEGGDRPLSFAQQRLWFLDQLETGNPAYNIAIALQMKGSLNVTALEQSLNEIVRRHETLRTYFKTASGQPVAEIKPSAILPLPIVDCQNIAEAKQLAKLEIQQPFDLTNWPLIRAKLVRVDPEDYILIFTTHHIISDGWSAEILIREIAAFYQLFSQGNFSPLSELPVQYADFAIWQKQWLQGEVLETQLSYWKQQLDKSPTVLQLPSDRLRPAIQSSRGSHHSLIINKSLTEALKYLARQENATLFMVLLAAFKTLLYRYSGQDDIAIGSPIANRNLSEIRELIGFFVNTIVLRTHLSENLRFRELLSEVRKVALGAYAHQDLPFERLVEVLQPERDLSHTPLFQVMFNLRNAPPLAEIPGLILSQFKVEGETSQFDLSLDIEVAEKGLIASFEYNTDLFEAATIARMAGHFCTLLEGIVANPDQGISQLPILKEVERQQLLLMGNQTYSEYPNNLCVHQLFEAQVEQTPEAIAVVVPSGAQLTYRELNQRANQLGRYLQFLRVGPEVLVGICAERSLDMVIGLLAILKAGGAYVPLDPSYPKDRLAFVLEDAAVSVLITQQHLLEKIPYFSGRKLCLDADLPQISLYNSDNLVNSSAPENLAYVIYTSGSTGKPKGAMNVHKALSNRLLWMQDAYQLTETDRVLQKTPFSFDVSVWEFFWPLIVGARLVLAKPGGHLDSAYLVDVIVKEEITTLHFVPSMLQIFLEEKSLEMSGSIDRVICSGEALSFELKQRFFERLNAELHNLYGPTEAAIDVTFHACDREDKRGIVPIGRAIASTQIYLLDRHFKPVPIGVPGELHIGGIGLARGYLNRPDLTAEKFIPNPFSQKIGARLYKTGDLARYLPDGNIDFLGRIDRQVKLRGFRIELGEIEAVLNQHPAIREAVVAAREDKPGNKQLVAYVVLQSEYETIEKTQLRDFVKEKLPEYMVPVAFAILEAMPLTSNGKLDRRSLPKPEDYLGLEVAYAAPKTEIEKIIAAAWQEVLGLEKVGINHNFFDLGGHSLLIGQVRAKLQQKFEQNLSVVELFQYPTIRSLAQHLSQNRQEKPAFRAVINRAEKQIAALGDRKNLRLFQSALNNQKGK